MHKSPQNFPESASDFCCWTRKLLKLHTFTISIWYYSFFWQTKFLHIIVTFLCAHFSWMHFSLCKTNCFLERLVFGVFCGEGGGWVIMLTPWTRWRYKNVYAGQKRCITILTATLNGFAITEQCKDFLIYRYLLIICI